MSDEKTLKEARLFVNEWLWKSLDRTSVQMPWPPELVEDAARMVAAAPKSYRHAVNCPGDHPYIKEESETFYSRRGCLACDTWLEPERLKR